MHRFFYFGLKMLIIFRTSHYHFFDFFRPGFGLLRGPPIHSIKGFSYSHPWKKSISSDNIATYKLLYKKQGSQDGNKEFQNPGRRGRRRPVGTWFKYHRSQSLKIPSSISFI